MTCASGPSCRPGTLWPRRGARWSPSSVRCSTPVAPSRQRDESRKPRRSARQARTSAEILVIDDGSTDRTPALLAEERGIRTIRHAYNLLGLQTFFTAGPKEVRAWTTKTGATAPQAALQGSAAAKVSVTQLAFEVANEALQMFGGNGMTHEYRLHSHGSRTLADQDPHWPDPPHEQDRRQAGFHSR